jgi:hypothetical protein
MVSYHYFYQIQDFLFDDVLFKYCTYPAMVDVIESIIGPNITGAHSMLINKPPDSDPGASLHPMHQDLHYFPFRPAEKIAASWTAMERVDENNGCLYVVPGTHKGQLYEHTYPDGYKNKLYHGIHGLDHLKKVHVVMEKGDTVFFHPVLLHGSGPNCTKVKSSMQFLFVDVHVIYCRDSGKQFPVIMLIIIVTLLMFGELPRNVFQLKLKHWLLKKVFLLNLLKFGKQKVV